MGGRINIRILVIVSSALVVLFAVSVLFPVRERLSLKPDTLPAGGSGSARLAWSRENVYGNPVPFYPWVARVVIKKGGEKVRIIGSQSRQYGPACLELGLRPTGEPGEVILDVGEDGNSHRRTLRLLAMEGDRDDDGIPDSAELTDASDREAFVRWFVAIAEAQFFRPDPRWATIHRDCAGLLRFAYKEALKKHDESWLSSIPYLHRQGDGDVERYNYPDVPVLGERIFRVCPGSYRSRQMGTEYEGMGTECFSASAGARALWEYNMVFVTKEQNQARIGDLLVFRDFERQPSPMHTMVLIDPPDRPGGPRVVYHTGSIDEKDPGEVRLVSVEALNAHRDESWHVRRDNPEFLGFYRWKILVGGRP